MLLQFSIQWPNIHQQDQEEEEPFPLSIFEIQSFLLLLAQNIYIHTQAYEVEMEGKKTFSKSTESTVNKSRGAIEQNRTHNMHTHIHTYKVKLKSKREQLTKQLWSLAQSTMGLV